MSKNAFAFIWGRGWWSGYVEAKDSRKPPVEEYIIFNIITQINAGF
jgi:hypothetical protein